MATHNRKGLTEQEFLERMRAIHARTKALARRSEKASPPPRPVLTLIRGGHDA